MKLYNYEMLTKQTKGLKALVVSDIHYTGLIDNAKLIDILLELDGENYDALFIVGDIIDSTEVLKEEYSRNFLIDFMKNLGSFIPTYIAYGEHDIAYLEQNNRPNKGLWGSDKITFLRDFLNVIAGFPGIHVAESRAHDLTKGYTVNIINPSAIQAINSINGKREIFEKALIRCNFLKSLRNRDTNILLCYDPRIALYLYSLGYLNRIDLCLCGYTHGGYVQFKYLPVESFMNLFSKNKGLVEPIKPAIFEHIDLARGKYDLENGMTMLINPAMTPLPESKGKLSNLNFLFYKSASVINYKPQKELERVRK